jgi:hypothetical protein
MRFLVKAISGQPLLHVILENAERAEGRIFVAAYDEFSILKDRGIGLSLLTSLISEPRAGQGLLCNPLYGWPTGCARL